MIKNIQKRYVGTLPKIGIRPIVDAKQSGVARKKCEKITLDLVRNLAESISQNLKYPNGLPIECVIPDVCIGGVTESAMCTDKFNREGVGVSISVAISWCYPCETMDMDPLTPKAAIGMNNPDGSGAVYLAALMSAHNQEGLPCFSMYGKDVQALDTILLPQDVTEKLFRFTRAAIAVAYMRGKTYLSVGSVSMGIASSIIDRSFFHNYLGMRVQSIDMTEVKRRLDKNIFDAEEFVIAQNWAKEYCKPGQDFNPKEEQISQSEIDASWDDYIKMALIVKDMMIGNEKLKHLGYPEEAIGYNALAGGFQGQRHWTDFMPVSDFFESLFNSTFDWTGIRQPLIFATENDSLNAVTMLFGNLLTGQSQIFGDIRTYWSPESVYNATGKHLTGKAAGGIIHIANSGPAAIDATGAQTRDGKPVMKPFWDVTEEDVENCMNAVKWCPAETLSFCGKGFHTRLRTKGEMPVTLSRLNIVKGLGPVLQIAQGHIIDLPDDIHNELDRRTSPSWPTSWFVPILTGNDAFTDVYTVMNKWGSNHGVFTYGHIGADLITLASILRIPVLMHNVSENEIYRPSAWDSFGTHNQQDADRAACQYYGPIYGKYN